MEKMPGHPRLYRRGATYYHRAAIPADIRETYPKSEETFSLGTKDYQTALKEVRIAAVQVDRRFDDHRRKLAADIEPALNALSAEQIRKIGNIYYRHLLDEDEETREVGFYDPEEPLRADPVPSFDEYVEDLEALEANLRFDYARGKSDVFFADEAAEVLTWSGVNLKLDPKSESWRPLARELMAASINAAEAKKARNTGEVIRTPEAPGPEATADTVLLSHALKEWADEKARTSWVAKTEHEHRVWTQHFLATVGDRGLPTYSKSDSRAFKSTLLKLPANWNKYDALKGLTIHDAAIKAEELGLSPMSDSNVNKLLGFVGSFWSWAEVNIEGTPPNLFRGLKVKTKRTARDLRDPFSAEELKAIFSAPLYTGCQSARGWRKRGDIVPRDTGMFWVPIVRALSEETFLRRAGMSRSVWE